jgi:hypothetical protein
MDFTDALKAGGASATIIAILGIAVKVFQSFCGHRLRSECCGKEATIGVGVENMTPKSNRPSLSIPPPVEPLERAVCVDVEGKTVEKSIVIVDK